MDWDEMAQPWLAADEFLEASHEPVMSGLMERAAPTAGSRVLDVGCGTGPGVVRVAKAVGPDGHATGVDVSPLLLRRASEKAPSNASFIEGDAGTVRYPDAGFDALISHFGTMFFPDTRSAFAHLRGTVSDGARFDFVVWSGPQHNPWFGIPRRAVMSRIPDLPAPDPAAPGPMRFADPAPLVAVLGEAGWGAEVDTVDLRLEPPGDAEHVADHIMQVTGTTMLRGIDANDEDRGAIRDQMVLGFAEYERDGKVTVPAQVHYISARAV